MFFRRRQNSYLQPFLDVERDRLCGNRCNENLMCLSLADRLSSKSGMKEKNDISRLITKLYSSNPELALETPYIQIPLRRLIQPSAKSKRPVPKERPQSQVP